MIISHQHKFVVFLPWKTASQTIYARLQAFNESPYSRFFEFNPFLNRVVHQHMTCADFELLPESKHGYFRASFVRNPYDRAYSGFCQLKKDILVQPSEDFGSSWIRSLVLKQLDENRAQIEKADGNFDRWMELIDEGQILEQGRNSNFPLHPAYYWTHIGLEKAVDFIGKVENFEADITRLAKMLNVGEMPLVNENIAETDNSSFSRLGKYKYQDRMNKVSVAKINHLFQKDFELFNYEQIAV